MSRIAAFLCGLIVFFQIPVNPTEAPADAAASAPIIATHRCTQLSDVPDFWINTARSGLRLAYGHTSHGSQIVTGMTVLMGRDDLYAFNYSGSSGALSLHDYEPEGDLGNPDRTTWYYRTRALLNDPSCDRNVIMWSWCGQANTSEENIDLYLGLMNQLETDYPGVRFIYMTGHLNGTGETGNLFLRNNQIRAYCRDNNKILFDFADIESYDPSGNYFRHLMADDNCDYDSDGNETRDSNWAAEWLAANPGSELAGLAADCGSCAHSQQLNCVLKGRAFWWMMARIAGWNPATGNRFFLDTDWDSANDLPLVQFGRSGDLPVTGDWTGGGMCGIGVFRPDNCRFYLDADRDGVADVSRVFGAPGDLPITGDWDGNGTTDTGVFRPDTCRFFLDADGNGVSDASRVFGRKGDLPITGDWDGDGVTETGVYRPETCTFFLDFQGNGVADIVRVMGRRGDLPIIGDWNGDGRDGIGIFRPETCRFFLDSNRDGIADISRSFGRFGDLPISGDWDGENSSNYGVFRR